MSLRFPQCLYHPRDAKNVKRLQRQGRRMADARCTCYSCAKWSPYRGLKRSIQGLATCWLLGTITILLFRFFVWDDNHHDNDNTISSFGWSDSLHGTYSLKKQQQPLVSATKFLAGTSTKNHAASDNQRFSQRPHEFHFYDCHEIFGWHQLIVAPQIAWNGTGSGKEDEFSTASSIRTNDTSGSLTNPAWKANNKESFLSRESSSWCITHRLLGWWSCAIGSWIFIQPKNIQGSLGGEALEDVWNRPESEEQLVFPKQSLWVPTPIPTKLLQSVDPNMRHFLQSAQVGLPSSSILSFPPVPSKTKSNVPISTTPTTTATTVIVRRGNYANPCMAMLSMYNVFVVLTMKYTQTRSVDESSPPLTRNQPQSPWKNDFHRLPIDLKIVWLDGHARSDLDAVWEHLFGTQPIHMKRLGQRKSSHILNVPNASSSSPISLPDAPEWIPLPNVIVVNTISAIGDEGMGLYTWKNKEEMSDTNTTSLKSSIPCSPKNSTLVAFRDFVLARYNMTHVVSNHPNKNSPPVLTFLVRKDHYWAHPRSTGQTDRTLYNITDDVLYLQGLYPNHRLNVVAFEGIPFEDQLQHVVTTDVFVAVHGAGNVHVLFMKPGATFVEFVPKNFRLRKRFRYLSECLNLNYTARVAWVVKQQEKRRQQPPRPQSMDHAIVGHSNTFSDSHEAPQSHTIQVRLRPPSN